MSTASPARTISRGKFLSGNSRNSAVKTKDKQDPLRLVTETKAAA